MSKITKIISKPQLLIVYLMNKKWFNFLPDKQYLQMKYYLIFGKKLNLNNPQTFNEKLQWLKLYDRKDLYTKLVDKYEVKKYVADIIGPEYIIPTLGIYDRFDEINFDDLPNQFVIKCTHDSGGITIVKDKTKMNIRKVKRRVNKFLRRKYYKEHREWPYKNIKPRILIEKYVTNHDGILNDVKIQTFNGKVEYTCICTDRATGNVKYTFYDKNKKLIPVTQCGAENDPKNAFLPKNYDKFVVLAEKLSQGIIQARVDFYDVDGKIYFGEFTFFDAAGFGKFEPEKWDYIFGEMLQLEKHENNCQK